MKRNLGWLVVLALLFGSSAFANVSVNDDDEPEPDPAIINDF